MPTYRYTVKSSVGQITSGMINAESSTAASAILRNQGAYVQSLSLQATGLDAKGLLAKLRELNAGRPTQKHVLDFTTQLAVMVRAGINLRSALEGIADQTEHVAFKKVLNQMRNDVDGGLPFSAALARHPKLFNPLYYNMVKASELSGGFSKMLDRIAGYIAQQLETRKMVIGAAIYPAIIGSLAICVTIFLLTFVLPKFAMVFKGKEDVLPWATTFLLALSDFMVRNWYLLVLALAGIGGGIFAFTKTDVGSFWIDKMKLTIPILRTMFKSLYISRSLQTMGQLINAGVPLLDTLSITGDISGNTLFRGMWKKVHTSVKQGNKIASPLIKERVLPTAVTQMISAGEESGKLGEVLDEIAIFYAKALKDNIKAVTGMIEPIMILLMGSIVGFIAMAVILPIFKMSQIVK